jgi:hypothetical protein
MRHSQQGLQLVRIHWPLHVENRLLACVSVLIPIFVHTQSKELSLIATEGAFSSVEP